METMKLRSSLIVVLFLAALIAYTYALRYRDIESPPAPSLDSVPIEVGAFRGSTEAEDPQALELLGADATLFRTYRSDSGRVAWLFIGYFGTQHENSQIHSPKHCYPGAGWNILEEGSTRIALGDGEIPAKSLVISDGVRTHYILYWFSSADGIVTNEFALKWNQMKNSLLARPQATAFVRFSMDATGFAEGASGNDLVRFARALAPRIEEILRASGAAPRVGAGVGGYSARADSEAASPERTP
ncbi:MAG: EpsI family protein [Candidatus Krumholzibacteria bacterium]|nr:EpsI family protein [Candidatus Krumholzibacteria bacterium]